MEEKKIGTEEEMSGQDKLWGYLVSERSLSARKS
jgi:hypothetical protein